MISIEVGVSEDGEKISYEFCRRSFVVVGVTEISKGVEGTWMVGSMRDGEELLN